MISKCWLMWLVVAFLLSSCADRVGNHNGVSILIRAGQGQLIFARQVTYVVDENDNDLSLNVPTSDLESDPVWSPDGQWIAFGKRRTSLSDWDIYLMSADGKSSPIPVTDNPGIDLGPDWSPDGTRIVYHSYRRGRGYEIYILNVSCVLQNSRCNETPKFVIAGDYPSWSPDGLDIVYRDVANDGIYVFRADGLSEPKRINHDLTRCNHPQWSPDGTKIAFACNGTIYSVSPDGASLTPLVDGGVYLRWSPDGQRIAFIGTKVLDASLGKTLDIEGTIESTAVFIMDANGTNIKRITSRNDESIGWLTWIPAVQGKK